MEMEYIYCLHKDGDPFYVGRTKCLHRRISDHKKSYGNISFVILKHCKTKYAHFYEKKYIKFFLKYGFKLKNRVFTKPKRVHGLLFDFGSVKNKRRCQIYAIKNGISLSEMIDVALEEKYPKLIK